MPAIDRNALTKQIRKAFSDAPKPRLGLLPDFRSGDIYESVVKRFDEKEWTEIGLDDWISTATVGALVHAFTPASFHYYLPSLLIGAAADLTYLDWGLHALLPQNKAHVPRGDWWFTYRCCFSAKQIAAVRRFIRFAVEQASPDSEDMHLAQIADDLWKQSDPLPTKS